MKKQLFTLSLVIISLLITSALIAMPRINGSGNVIKEKRNVSTFSGIDAGSAFKIFVKQGTPQSLEVETDDNIMDLIKTTVSGNTLRINLETNKSINNPTKMNIYITMENITDIDLSGAATLKFETPVNAGNRIDIDLSGASSIKDAEIKADKIDLDISGAAVINVNINCKNLKLDASGAAKTTLDGKVTDMKIDASGAASVKMSGLKSETSKITASGAASVRVSKNTTHNMNSSGAASIRVD